MKKIYQAPEMIVVKVGTTLHILAGSGGVANGDSVGNEYLGSDVSYGRGYSVWDDED